MYLSNIVTIEKSVLIRALGLQKYPIDNVAQYVVSETVLDDVATGCAECPSNNDRLRMDTLDYYEKKYAKEVCDTCPQAVYKTIHKTVPFTTRHPGTYLPRLSKNSLKLFLLYQFLVRDEYGTLIDLDIHDLAAEIGCTPQTIMNCHYVLSSYGYVKNGASDYQGCLTFYLDVFQPRIKYNFKDSEQFIVLTKDILKKLLELPVNALRVALRAFLELDFDAQNATQTGRTFSYSELRRYLPDYCHPNIVKKTLEKLQGLFDISISDHSSDIILTEDKNPHQEISRDRQKAMKEVKTSAFLQKRIDDKERDLFIRLAIQHSYKKVKEAFSYFQTYKVQTESFIGWLRSFIYDPIPVSTA
ncbi:hypothetical protein P261_01315 [Lachnospiraceae bacterium TWA4]|nr:hypothetical protein P261_01315 [Lachnospiraceae bacterium TWA4]